MVGVAVAVGVAVVAGVGVGVAVVVAVGVGVVVGVGYMKPALLILALSGWVAFGLQTNHIQVSGNDFQLKPPMSCYTGVSTAVYPWDQIKQERKK